jgi:putative ABC transport system permease protein
LVNETAMKLLGFTDPEKIVGQKIYVWDAQLEIVGVVKNFHQESLRKNVDQLIFVCDTEISNYYAIKINAGGSLTDVVSKAETKYRSAFPGNPFHYFFLDDFFNQQYQSDVLFEKVFGLFTLLAVVIASLGLFGLSSYMVVKRTKEIGVRKILGASVNQIALLVSREFIVIIVIANVIAWPIAWLIMGNWLKGFAFRIDLGILFFLIPTAISLLVAILTIATQSVRAANVDPVKNLRSE